MAGRFPLKGVARQAGERRCRDAGIAGSSNLLEADQ
jgi:hypothetical protein